MSLKIDEVIAVLSDSGVPSDKVAIVRKELEQIETEKKEERADNKTPKAKSEYVIVLSDPDGKVKGDFVGWVVQIEEGQSPAAVLDKIKTAAATQNSSVKKFIKNPLKTFADAFENVRRKFTKTEKVHVKTKTPVLVVVTDGKL